LQPGNELSEAVFALLPHRPWIVASASLLRALRRPDLQHVFLSEIDLGKLQAFARSLVDERRSGDPAGGLLGAVAGRIDDACGGGIGTNDLAAREGSAGCCIGCASARPRRVKGFADWIDPVVRLKEPNNG